MVPWCGLSSTATVHTEKLGVRSDAAPANDLAGAFYFPASTLVQSFNFLANRIAGSASMSASHRTENFVVMARRAAERNSVNPGVESGHSF